MAQILSALGMKGVGIVSVLIIAGIALKFMNISAEASNLAIWGGIAIGILLGILGVFGVGRRVFG